MQTNLDTPLKLQQRTVVRKQLASLRAQGLVPAVIHNHGQESIYVMAPELKLIKIYRQAGKHHPLNLNVGDRKFLALLKMFIFIRLSGVWITSFSKLFAGMKK